MPPPIPFSRRCRGINRYPDFLEATKKSKSAIPPRGQPTKYQPEFCERARNLCEGGALDVDLAEAFGVNIRTIYAWKAEYSEFREAIKRSRHAADDAGKAKHPEFSEATKIGKNSRDFYRLARAGRGTRLGTYPGNSVHVIERTRHARGFEIFRASP